MADKRGTHTHILHLRAASVALAAGIALLTLMAARSAQAQIFTTLFTFDGTDGENPTAGLVQTTDGNLYGTTSDGGRVLYYGAVFRVSTSGTLNVLHIFCSESRCTDGNTPYAGLVQATDGNLYGTTSGGGANGAGTVFTITPSGTLTVVYSFCAQGACTDGEEPMAGLIQATDGNFYGTTFAGGASGYGTVFKITPGGTLTTLYSFCSQSGCTDGDFPKAALIQGSDGNLYGATVSGGFNQSCPDYGCGTVFKITPTGTLTTLYSFCSQGGCMDGGLPHGGLVQAADGSLYGTTSQGAANEFCPGDGCGTVFKITPTGALTTLYSFCSQSACPDGSAPQAGLIQATDGNFYGTTAGGGAYQGGTVFKITPTGTLTTLYSFCSQAGCTDGDFPEAGLVQDTNGNFYGTTVDGGIRASCPSYGCGTVFSLSVGLGPFVETQTTSGKVGAAVKILGTDLTGATSVTFNGISAVFNVLSPSLIGARVPAGATSGTVQVVTPGGTLSSNVPFRVRQ